MFNIKKILIIIFVILSFGIAFKFYKKYKNSEKLKIGDVSLKATKEIKNLNDLISVINTGLILKGFVQIRNFSSQDFTLNQISIDGFSPVSNKLIAEQTNIIQKDIVIKSKQVTNIPIEYKLNISKAISLFSESGVIPENTTVWNIITHPVMYYDSVNLKKLKVILKGFIQAEGITLNINQELFIYD